MRGETYRLRGSCFLRPLVLAIGSKDFSTSSDGTALVREPADSRSLTSTCALDDALSETLRRQQKPLGMAEGAKARGNDLARYLDGSLAAIEGDRKGGRSKMNRDPSPSKNCVARIGDENLVNSRDGITWTGGLCLPEKAGHQIRQPTQLRSGSTCDQLQSSPRRRWRLLDVCARTPSIWCPGLLMRRSLGPHHSDLASSACSGLLRRIFPLNLLLCHQM